MTESNDCRLPFSNLNGPKGQIFFSGTRAAELFTREIYESLEGLIRQNFMGRFEGSNVGFLHASFGGRPWENTMWSRDAATVLREFVHFGLIDEAALLAECLLRLVQPNASGYACFPEYFALGQPGTGTELDGTSGVVIGLELLWHRLPPADPLRDRICDFLHGPHSPLEWICQVLTTQPLIPGSGEFGGGCGIPGQHMNVVQNGLCRLALLAAARLGRATGDSARATRYEAAADNLTRNMLAHLVDAEGGWIWCVNPDTLQPDPEIVNHFINKGFGGLNGVMAMQCDVLGFDTTGPRWFGVEPSRATFDKLLNFPLRREQFEKYGIWTQFDEPPLNLNMSPSYGQGYALQTMLLLDEVEHAGHGLDFLAEYTYTPPRGYRLDRTSPYWFFERYLSPDAPNKDQWDQGCGALNAVCVAEPLKVARLLLGLDDSRPDHTLFLPRLPKAWTGVTATAWPLHTERGVVHVDLKYERRLPNCILTLDVRDGVLPKLEIRADGHSECIEQVQTLRKEWPRSGQ